jgi:protein CLEC16A
MSILLENISTQASIYYLLSNDRVNEIIQFHFDFSDEELMAYYISFLKTLSLKLDASTVQFFFNHQTQQFPLYTESVKFFNHSEGMVRTGVRTISLAVFKVSEPSVRAFIVSGESTPYFTNLVWFIQSKAEELDKVIARVPSSPRAQHKFRDCIDELADLLYYIQDIYALKIEELNEAMTHNLMTKLSDFVNSLSSMSKTAPRVALYVLGQIFYIIKDDSLVRQLGQLILDNPHHRIMILQLLQTDQAALPSLFLLLCLSRNHTTAPALLAKSLARQSSLLDVILGESDSSPAVKEVWNDDEQALVLALAGLLQRPLLSVNIPSFCVLFVYLFVCSFCRW